MKPETAAVSRESEEVRDHAALAAEMIRRVGWRNGGLGVIGGSVCAVGAIMMCKNRNRDARMSYNQALSTGLYATFREIVGEGVAYWNDRPERTEKEVLAVFDMIATRNK